MDRGVFREPCQTSKMELFAKIGKGFVKKSNLGCSTGLWMRLWPAASVRSYNLFSDLRNVSFNSSNLCKTYNMIIRYTWQKSRHHEPSAEYSSLDYGAFQNDK